MAEICYPGNSLREEGEKPHPALRAADKAVASYKTLPTHLQSHLSLVIDKHFVFLKCCMFQHAEARYSFYNPLT